MILYNADCIKCVQSLGESSVDLVVTSPPYNLDIAYGTYDDNRSLKSYLLFVQEFAKGVFRVLKDGGRVCINVPPDIGTLKDKDKVSIDSLYYLIFRKSGFFYRTKIVWNKNTISSRTAWGSFCSPSNPNILPSFEYILVFYKGTPKKEGRTTDLTKEEFIQWTNGLWTIAPESKKKIGHPAPFPVELSTRLIKMFSYVGDIVLDPFMGSGTTGLSCKQLNREFIGIELDTDYFQLAKERIENAII